MTSLLHISDTHFGTEQEPVVEALVRMAAEQDELDAIVISGDITQRARRSQFRKARSVVDRLPRTRVVVVPGNHDIPLFNLPVRLLAPYGGYRRAFGGNLEPEYESERMLIVGVNTTRPARHVDGEVSAEQIERVAKRLADATDDHLRIVVTHHPVHVITRVDRKNLLHGHGDAVRSWARAGADLVLSGHIHLPYVRSLHDDFPDLPRRMWAVQAGTAVSSRIRGRTSNSVNVLRYAPAARPRQCVIEKWDYRAPAERFELASTTIASLSRGV
jgi:3',5'-cyclic AMP phosphodiesterase CpdA